MHVFRNYSQVVMQGRAVKVCQILMTALIVHMDKIGGSIAIFNNDFVIFCFILFFFVVDFLFFFFFLKKSLKIS